MSVSLQARPNFQKQSRTQLFCCLLSSYSWIGYVVLATTATGVAPMLRRHELPFPFVYGHLWSTCTAEAVASGKAGREAQSTTPPKFITVRLYCRISHDGTHMRWLSVYICFRVRGHHPPPPMVFPPPPPWPHPRHSPKPVLLRGPAPAADWGKAESVLQ